MMMHAASICGTGRKLPTSSTSPHTITRNAALCRPFSGTEALKYGHANTGHDAAAHTMPTIPGTMPSTVRSAAARQKLRPRGSSFRFVASISIITPAATVAILNTRSARMLNSSIAPPKIFSAADRMPMP